MRLKLGRKTNIALSLALGILLVSAGSYLQPWKLFTDTRVEEALPQVSDLIIDGEEAAPEKIEDKVTKKDNPSAPKETAEKANGNTDSPVVLTQGRFITHEHSTTGLVKILQYVDGTRILRIEDLNTSNGPKLEVWLTDAPVIEGLDGWRVFDDGKYINLGALKGNIGSQNYVIPSNLNLDDYSSISIWCERFSVSFGAAELNIP